MRTTDVVCFRLPAGVVGETRVVVPDSVKSASSAASDNGIVSIAVGPCWFNSRDVRRPVYIRPLNGRNFEGCERAGNIEVLGKTYKVFVDFSPAVSN